MAQKRAVMTFNAELTAECTRIATVTRHDKAITISVVAQAENESISEVSLTISCECARDLAKKLIHRLSEMYLW